MEQLGKHDLKEIKFVIRILVGWWQWLGASKLFMEIFLELGLE